MAIKKSVRKTLCLSLLTVLLSACADDSSRRGSGAACPTTEDQASLNYALSDLANPEHQGKYLVKLSDMDNFADLREQLITAHRQSSSEGKIKIEQVHGNLLSVDIPIGSPALAVLHSFQQEGKTSYVEPDYKTFSFPSDGNDFEYLEAALSQMEMDDAVTTTEIKTEAAAATREVIVAVIDSGVDYTHKDLAPYMWTNTKEIPNNGIDDDRNGYVDDVRGWDFANNDNNPMSDDKGSYHGTHVAGIVRSAALLSQKGINLKIMPIKYLNSNGSGYSSNAIRSIDYAIRNGASILNNSWGSGSRSQALIEAIERARKAHTLFIAAAGNGDSRGVGINIDSRPFYPAAYTHENIISVAAADSRKVLTRWSNYGRRSVDLAAPGASIRSTINGNKYANKSGTSMAAPYVAGVAAAIWSLRPELSYREVIHLLYSTSIQGSSFNNKLATSGHIDRVKALSQAANFVHDPADERYSDLGPTVCSP